MPTGELRLEFDKAAGLGGVVVAFSGVAARLRKQVEEADPHSDFGTWLQTDREVAMLGWDVKETAAYIKGLEPAERKRRLCQALEETRQDFLERERAQLARAERHRETVLVQRSLPGSMEIVGKILRYETTIERQLYRAIAELKKLQSNRRRRTSSPANGPTEAA